MAERMRNWLQTSGKTSSRIFNRSSFLQLTVFQPPILIWKNFVKRSIPVNSLAGNLNLFIRIWRSIIKKLLSP